MSQAAFKITAQHLDWANGLAYVYLQHQKTDKAIALWEALHATDPENPDFLKSLSYAYYSSQQPAKACEYAHSYLTCTPHPTEHSSPIYLLLSKCYWALAEKEKALHYKNLYLAQQQEGSDE